MGAAGCGRPRPGCPRSRQGGAFSARSRGPGAFRPGGEGRDERDSEQWKLPSHRPLSLKGKGKLARKNRRWGIDRGREGCYTCGGENPGECRRLRQGCGRAGGAPAEAGDGAGGAAGLSGVGREVLSDERESDGAVGPRCGPEDAVVSREAEGRRSGAGAGRVPSCAVSGRLPRGPSGHCLDGRGACRWGRVGRVFP